MVSYGRSVRDLLTTLYMLGKHKRAKSRVCGWLILIGFCAFSIQACTTVYRFERPAELKTGSPLRALDSLTFRINTFSDKRLQQGNKIGRLRGKTIISDTPIPQIVYETLITELRRNGHQVVGSNDIRQPDAVIDGAVLFYWLEFRDVNVFTVEAIGTVKVDLSLRTPSCSNRSIEPMTYTGTYNLRSHMGITAGGMQGVLEEALLNVIKDFTTDPRVLDVLRQRQC